MPASHPRLAKAREFILDRAGALKTRVFTRIFLALFGQLSWDGIPLLPVEFILLPPWSGLSIYEFSSWTRATVVPLMIVMAHRPVCPLPPEQSVAEIFLDPRDPFERHRVTWRFNATLLENLFAILDRILKLFHRIPLPWLRRLALSRAEAWILAHQEESGDWGGIQPAMLNSLLALACRGYGPTHEVVRRGLEALEFFSLQDNGRLRLQSCISPVWDAALTALAFLDAGCPPDHPVLKRVAEWLISKQVKTGGDWQVKNCCPPGGWAFEFHNSQYPDVDDSAVVLMVLQRLHSDHHCALEEVRKRGLDWCLSMQSQSGGWAAFDKDNTLTFLNWIPFAEHGAMVDFPTADVTGRMLEIMGDCCHDRSHRQARLGVHFILESQEKDGCCNSSP